MGRAVANASNAAQGWRDGAKPKPPEQPTMKMGEGKCGHGKAGEGKCGGAAWQKQHKGNRYRAGHDDGGRNSRRGAGTASAKHRSPTI